MDLHTWADISAILTCLFVIVGYLKWQIELYQKSKRVEARLQQTRQQNTTIHLIRHCQVTEQEIINISFRNKHVHCVTHVNPMSGKADELLFEYAP